MYKVILSSIIVRPKIGGGLIHGSVFYMEKHGVYTWRQRESFTHAVVVAGTSEIHRAGQQPDNSGKS